MQNKLLAAKAALPDYDRTKLVTRIVHLGFGAFHRAHQGVYADILAADHGSDWGYCRSEPDWRRAADFRSGNSKIICIPLQRCLLMPGLRESWAW